MSSFVEKELLQKVHELNIPGLSIHSLQDAKDQSLNRLFLSLFALFDPNWAQECEDHLGLGEDKKQVKSKIMRYLRLMEVAHLIPNTNALRPGNAAIVRCLGSIFSKLEDKYGTRLKTHSNQFFKSAVKRKLIHGTETLSSKPKQVKSGSNMDGACKKVVEHPKTPSRDEAPALPKTPMVFSQKLMDGQPLTAGSVLRGREIPRSPIVQINGKTPCIARQNLELQDHGSPALHRPNVGDKGLVKRSPEKRSEEQSNAVQEPSNQKKVMEYPETPSRDEVLAPPKSLLGFSQKLMNGQPLTAGSVLRGREILRSPPVSQGNVKTPCISRQNLELQDHGSPALYQPVGNKTPEKKSGEKSDTVHVSSDQVFRSPSLAKLEGNAIPTGNQLSRTPTDTTVEAKLMQMLNLSSYEEEAGTRSGSSSEKEIVDNTEQSNNQSLTPQSETGKIHKNTCEKGANQSITEGQSKESNSHSNIENETEGNENAEDSDVPSKSQNETEWTGENSSANPRDDRPLLEKSEEPEIVSKTEVIPTTRSQLVLADTVAPVALQCPSNMELTENDREFLQQQQDIREIRALEQRSQALKKQLDQYVFQKGLLDEEFKSVSSEIENMETDMKVMRDKVRVALSDVTHDSPSVIPDAQKHKLLTKTRQQMAARIARYEKQLEKELEVMKRANETLNNTFNMMAKKETLEREEQTLQETSSRVKEAIKEQKDSLDQLKRDRRETGSQCGAGRDYKKRRLELLTQRLQSRNERRNLFNQWFA